MLPFTLLLAYRVQRTFCCGSVCRRNGKAILTAPALPHSIIWESMSLTLRATTSRPAGQPAVATRSACLGPGPCDVAPDRHFPAEGTDYFDGNTG